MLRLLCASWILVAGCGTAFSQGVIWQLPADGTSVRFEGSYAHKELTAQPTDAEIPPWAESVTIKSVGTGNGNYQGKPAPCRWIEIKVERGRVVDGKIDTGLTGLEIYKVLVPEASVKSDAVDADGVPVVFVPVVKGYRQIGKTNPVPTESGAFQPYPLAILTGHFRAVNNVSPGEAVNLGGKSYPSTLWDSQNAIERRGSRTIIHSKLLRCNDIPFGVGGWDVSIIREQKDEQAPRDSFKKTSEVTVKMRAVEIGRGAQSELNLN